MKESKGAHLNSIEVQVSLVGAGGDGGGSATAHADAVSWASNLDNQHAHLWVQLLQVSMINLPQPSTTNILKDRCQWMSSCLANFQCAQGSLTAYTWRFTLMLESFATHARRSLMLDNCLQRICQSPTLS